MPAMKTNYLTKKEAEQQFLEMYPECKTWDRAKQALYWNVYTDDLHRDGQIRDSQRNTWLYPRYFKKYK